MHLLLTSTTPPLKTSRRGPKTAKLNFRIAKLNFSDAKLSFSSAKLNFRLARLFKAYRRCLSVSSRLALKKRSTKSIFSRLGTMMSEAPLLNCIVVGLVSSNVGQ